MLNAFRHQRSNHPETRVSVLPWQLCSTPFGIRDRISASTISGAIYATSCSTPFGIRGRIRSLVTSHRASGFWCSTPFGIRDRTTSSTPSRAAPAHCAQRLSASEIEPRIAPNCSSTADASAQRLSASEVEPRWIGCWRRHGHAVLNAFRHQR